MFPGRQWTRVSKRIVARDNRVISTLRLKGHLSMPSGDAQRAWFPEMLSELEHFWVGSPDWADVIAFCEQMTLLRADIHHQRGIRPPMMTCRSCGGKHPMTLPPVSPRSLLFALQKIDVIAEDGFKRLDKEWMRYRKTENLDARGQRSADDQARTSPCRGTDQNSSAL